MPGDSQEAMFFNYEMQELEDNIKEQEAIVAKLQQKDWPFGKSLEKEQETLDNYNSLYQQKKSKLTKLQSALENKIIELTKLSETNKKIAASASTKRTGKGGEKIVSITEDYANSEDEDWTPEDLMEGLK